MVRTVKLAAPNVCQVVVSKTTDLLYVAAPGGRNANAAKVLGLNLRTPETRSTFDLGADLMFGLGVNDRTATLYGSNILNGRIVALDLRTGR